MGKTTELAVPRALRWSLWLVAGVVFGVLVGFAVGLTKPHVSSSRPAPRAESSVR